ncbi:MAG: hypothetical protein NZ822_01000 [Patescibacteria group bacterium]|nr:hypothetical protein [Patescibacteria group bacterium]
MTDIYYLIFGFLFIFTSLLLTLIRLKQIRLTIEDYGHWRRIEAKFNLVKNKLLKIVKLSERESKYLFFNFIEKMLMRIKIEALKIENWAAKKLENLRKNNSEPA